MELYFSEDTATHWMRFEDGDEIYLELVESDPRVSYKHWSGGKPTTCTADRNKAGFPIKGTCSLCDEARTIWRKRGRGLTKKAPGFAKAKYYYSVKILGDAEGNEYDEVEEEEEVIMTLTFNGNENFKKLLKTIARYHEGHMVGIPFRVIGTATSRGTINWIALDFDEPTDEELKTLLSQHKKEIVKKRKAKKSLKKKKGRKKKEAEEEEEETTKPDIKLTEEEEELLADIDGMEISKKDFKISLSQDADTEGLDLSEERIDELTKALIIKGRVVLP